MRFVVLIALLTATPELAAAKTPVSVTGAVSTPADPVTCRKYKVTGSLIGRVRECRTASEWRRVTQAARDTSRKMMIDNMGKPSGN